SIRLGNDTSPWLVAWRAGSEWKATLEVPLSSGEYSHRLLKNFPAKVDFTWKNSAIRLDRDGIAIVVPPDASEDEVIAEAIFQLPLIELGGQDLLSNTV